MNQSSQYSYQNDTRKPTPSASNQQTKRSKGEMSFVNSPQIFQDPRKMRYDNNSDYSQNLYDNSQYNHNQSKDTSQELNRKYRNLSQPEDYSKSKGEDDYNRSSVSSNFSMFNPNEELKNFFQNDFLERRKQQSEMVNQVGGG